MCKNGLKERWFAVALRHQADKHKATGQISPHITLLAPVSSFDDETGNRDFAG